jgi:hypothetical protein
MNDDVPGDPVNDREIAYHEAGHAVAARVLGCRVWIATLSPPADAGDDMLGGVHVQTSFGALPPDADHVMQIAALEEDAIHWLAGPYAEHFASNSNQYCVTTDGDDLYWAEQWCEIATAISNGRCMLERKEGKTNFNWEGELCTAEAKELKKKVIAKTLGLVKERWPAIERVAEALLARRELNQAEIDELI